MGKESVLKEIRKHEENVPENLSLNEDIDSSEPELDIFDKEAKYLNIVDVYSLASSIGKEFERLTDKFGGLVFSSTMPKIIRLLEMFEQLVKLRESKDAIIITSENELESLKKQLQTKTLTEAQEMSKLQQAWDDNVKDLKRKNLQMEKDNRQLLAILSDQAEHSINEADFFNNVEEMNLLHENLEKLNHENQCKDRLVKEHIENCNALQSQNDSLAKINKDLHHKITILQQQSTALISDKNLLESKLKGKLENIRR